ncbi:hypothetical protein F5Y09DRAFT_312902 [Xylaria sp. FL1042]|nr:hypothetical protein F5Y09DRAFT_312902 [Xylaria sp. FL1042]
MQVRALVTSLLAVIVAAAPFAQKDSGIPDLENSFNDIGNGNENNPSLGSDNGNNNGNDNGNDNGNNNGSGNTIGSNNQFTSDNKFLNDVLNVNYGATSQQISKGVVTAMKSLRLTCNLNGGRAMTCAWESRS